jgi:threonine/homoserine/homoserine lactone efflux protein
MAWQSLRDGMGPMPCQVSSKVQSRKSAFAAGAGLSLSNSMSIPYWAALGGTIPTLEAADPDGIAFFVFIAGFMASSSLWCFVCAAGIGWTRRYVSPVLWRVFNLICAAGLLFFALLPLFRLAD